LDRTHDIHGVSIADEFQKRLEKDGTDDLADPYDWKRNGVFESENDLGSPKQREVNPPTRVHD